MIGAGLALVASGAWALDRLGLVANPLSGVESTLIAHPLWVVGALAALALVGTAAEAARPAPRRGGSTCVGQVVTTAATSPEPELEPAAQP